MTAPKIPGHTCPMIDRLKGAIDRAFKIADDADSQDVEVLQTLLRDIRRELLGESDNLEAIRDANLMLRNAAEYWQNKAEEIEESQ